MVRLTSLFKSIYQPPFGYEKSVFRGYALLNRFKVKVPNVPNTIFNSQSRHHCLDKNVSRKKGALYNSLFHIGLRDHVDLQFVSLSSKKRPHISFYKSATLQQAFFSRKPSNDWLYRNSRNLGFKGQDWKTTAIALAGGALTLILLPPLVGFAINVALAYGVYKLIKTGIQRYRDMIGQPDLFPNNGLNSRDNLTPNRIFPFSDFGIKNIFFPSTSSADIDKLFRFAIEKIQQMHRGTSRESEVLRFEFGDNPEVVNYSKPHSISMSSVSGFNSQGGGYNQNNIRLKFIAKSPYGQTNHALVRVTGSIMKDQNREETVKLEEILIRWGATGNRISVVIPENQTEYSIDQEREIPEAEFRDIK
ncbi:hypothetical protein G9A89_012326 [Geosiphon pyriformis]|nr:hypothetical protein G9A89_012326 [Geosiphon pyriformis]